MVLDEQQWVAFQQRSVVKQCPLCGADGLEFSRDVLVAPRQVFRPGVARATEGRLKVTCRSCGYIMEFDATVLGFSLPAAP